MLSLNRRFGLSQVEEALVVRELCRGGLSGVEVGILLGRHKSWVSRLWVTTHSRDYGAGTVMRRRKGLLSQKRVLVLGGVTASFDQVCIILAVVPSPSRRTD